MLVRGTVHVRVMGVVDRGGDVLGNRLDVDSLCEPESERGGDRLAVAMDGTVTATGCTDVLKASLLDRLGLCHKSSPSALLSSHLCACSRESL